MQFPLVGVGLALAASLLRGGRLRWAAHAELRWLVLLPFGLALQTLLDALAQRGVVSPAAAVALLLLSEAAVLGFCIVNWFRPGIWLVALGLLANATVILANGGMPVSPDAIIALGGDPSSRAVVGKHVLMTSATSLHLLADVIPIRPLRLIVSVGDVLLVAGLFPLAHHLLTPPGLEERIGRPVRPARTATAPNGAARAPHAVRRPAR